MQGHCSQLLESFISSRYQGKCQTCLCLAKCLTHKWVGIKGNEVNSAITEFI